MSCHVEYTEETRKALKTMPGRYRQRARRMIESLAKNPQPTGAKELRGLTGCYRLHLNGWRIIYQIEVDER